MAMDIVIEGRLLSARWIELFLLRFDAIVRMDSVCF